MKHIKLFEDFFQENPLIILEKNTTTLTPSKSIDLELAEIFKQLGDNTTIKELISQLL